MQQSTGSYNVQPPTFAESEYQASADKLIEIIKNGQDPYNIINRYVHYLRNNHNLSPLSLKQEVITIKNLLEYSDIEISPRKFKLKIKLPKIIKKSKQALSKEDIINILNSCEIRLKTYVMLLGSTGMRATEALSIRIKDLDLDSNPAKVHVGKLPRPKQIGLFFSQMKFLNN